MTTEQNLQGGSYVVDESSHTRVLVEQTKPVGDIAPEPIGEVVKLAVVKNKPATKAATSATTATQKEEQ